MGVGTFGDFFKDLRILKASRGRFGGREENLREDLRMGNFGFLGFLILTT